MMMAHHQAHIYVYIVGPRPDEVFWIRAIVDTVAERSCNIPIFVISAQKGMGCKLDGNIMLRFSSILVVKLVLCTGTYAIRGVKPEGSGPLSWWGRGD